MGHEVRATAAAARSAPRGVERGAAKCFAIANATHTPSFRLSVSSTAEETRYSPVACVRDACIASVSPLFGVESEGAASTQAFARLHALSQAQATALFAQHAADVAAHPEGNSHRNIRALVAGGLDGVSFDKFPLKPKPKA